MPTGPGDVGSIESDDGQKIARITGDFIDFGRRAVLGLESGGKVVTRLDQLDTRVTGEQLEELQIEASSNTKMIDGLLPQFKKFGDRLAATEKHAIAEIDKLALAMIDDDKVTTKQFTKLQGELSETITGHKVWLEETFADEAAHNNESVSKLEASISQVTDQIVAIAAMIDAQKIGVTELEQLIRFRDLILEGSSPKAAARDSQL